MPYSRLCSMWPDAIYREKILLFLWYNGGCPNHRLHFCWPRYQTHIREDLIHICRKLGDWYTFCDALADRTSLFYTFFLRWRYSFLQLTELGNFSFSIENVLQLCSVMLCREFPCPTPPWMKDLKAKPIWNRFSLFHGTTLKAAHVARTCCHLQAANLLENVV